MVPPMGSVTIAFDADNPGRWAFHCHNLYHMMTGMMTEVRYPAII
ncbi:MAG TPA: multicopper oxidase domain-containing protein [Nitrosospira sp.]|nr:multicopper oxidase domain-containing protein [Nitrosospira sp.]